MDLARFREKAKSYLKSSFFRKFGNLPPEPVSKQDGDSAELEKRIAVLAPEVKIALATRILANCDLVAGLSSKEAREAVRAFPHARRDGIRFATLYTLAAQINSREVAGAVAELGVYQGIFARHIRHVFPGRRLYLFDTFEGFTEDQAANHRLVSDREPNDFSRTSVELVLKNIGTRKGVVVKKGLFPATAAGIEDAFAFVSLDGDLYETTRDGLEFFYPRLAKGGHIMVHDGGNLRYPGSRRAVEEFCGKNGSPFVPIADKATSLLVSK